VDGVAQRGAHPHAKIESSASSPGPLLFSRPGPCGVKLGSGTASGCGTAAAAGRTLILRWDGIACSQVASPSPGGGVSLNAVSSSPGGSWACGRSLRFMQVGGSRDQARFEA